MITEIIKLRKELHRNPELSGFESKTAARIKSFIKAHHPAEIIENLGGHGFAVIFEFSSKGPTIAFRCELDALPIEEENEFAHKSQTKAVSHKCGHDGHMAIVTGLLLWLKKQNFENGRVVLLFLAAEETGKGAIQMLNDPRFTNMNIDYIFALHNIPGEPMQSIIVMDYGFSAEVQSFSIKLEGKESHASEPENGINPTRAIAQIIIEINRLCVVDPQDSAFVSFTPIYINMGQKAYGISPADGELHYTVRTWDSDKMNSLKLELERTVKRICRAYYLKFKIEWFEHFPAAKNNDTCNKIVMDAAQYNNLTIIERPYPFKFGEDFGWFSQEFKTSMFGLGAGLETPALHNTDYDFPDELIETGVTLFKTIITKFFEGKR